MKEEVVLPAARAGTVQLGDLTVNRMGFGAMRITGAGAWGNPDNVDLAKQVLKRAIELGVNFIDTADAYGPEVSENLIHDTLSPYKRIVIATKGGLLRPDAATWQPNASPEHLQEAIAGSQHRLGLKQIDLYQLHRPDPSVPFEDSVRALASLQKQGKIKHIGLSNVSLEQLKAARKIAPIVSVQNHYNILYRKQSEPILRYAEQQKIVFIPYFPIGGTSLNLHQPSLELVAKKHLADVQQISLAWLLHHSPSLLPIPGTTTIDHLEANIDAASIGLSAKDMQLLNRLDPVS